MKDDKELDEILAKIECYEWPEDDEPTIDAVTLVQTKAAIQSLIDTRVREGRIDEIDYLIANMVLPQNKHGFVADRLNELTKEGKQNE